MVQYIITPWRDQAELLTVRQQLYPQLTSTANLDFEDDASHDEQSQAVARISVWSQRGNCPHLVESTALLMAATLNDLPGNSAYSVRAAYAAAFGR